MIIDLPIGTAARVRKPRSRSALEAMHVVKRPVDLPSVSDDEAPLVAVSGTGEDPFGTPVQWRLHGGRWLAEVGRAADARTIVGAAVDAATRTIVSSGGAGRPTTSPDEVREVEASNEAAVTAWTTSFVADRFLVVGTRIFERRDPPVVTTRHVCADYRHEPLRRIEGLPACLWDLEADTIEKLTQRPGMRRKAASTPRIMRPDLLDFDRDAAIVRKLAADVLAASDVENQGRRDTLGPTAALARALRSDPDPASILRRVEKVVRTSVDASIWDTASIEAAGERPGLSALPVADDGLRASVEIPLVPGRSTRTTIRPRALSDAEAPVVAVVRHRQIEPILIRRDAEGLMSRVRQYPSGPPLDASGTDADARWRSVVANSLIDTLEDLDGTKPGSAVKSKPFGRLHDEEFARRMEKIAESEFVLVDGAFYKRVDEPYVVLDTLTTVVEHPTRGTGRRIRDALVAEACASAEGRLPFGLSEAAFAAEVAAAIRPDVPSVEVEILDPSCFPLSEARRVAAATAIRLAGRVPADLLGDEGRAADALFEEAEAVVSGTEADGFEDAARRMTALVDGGSLLAGLSGSPEIAVLQAWSIRSAELGAAGIDDDLPADFSMFS